MRFWRKFVDNVGSKFAFFPPSASYSLLPEGDGWTFRSSFGPTRFPHTAQLLTTRPTRRGSYGAEQTQVAAVFIPYKLNTAGGNADRFTLLCSHGNAVDLGQMLPIYKELSQLLKVNVVGYDYSGYGSSTGVASPSQTFADISAVYDWTVEDMGVPMQRVVLYGQSVGSGPTCWLAAQEKAIAGVVLHSPMYSGIRVLHPNVSWWPAWADCFPNHIYVPDIQASVLVLHGLEDEVIHVTCGQRLAKLAKKPAQHLWAKGCNHQDVESSPQYLPSLKQFLQQITPKL